MKEKDIFSFEIKNKFIDERIKIGKK